MVFYCTPKRWISAAALEAVLSTPSHHRVHHGMEPQYLDRNFGGFLIIWDRMFGTYALEQQRPTYGVTDDPIDDRIFSVGLRGYAKVAKRWTAAATLRTRAVAVFGPP